MQYYAGIDISLEQSSVCVVDAAGKITKEAKIASDPCVLATFFKGLGFPVTRIGFEAGPLSHWLLPGGACNIGELAGDSSAADGAPIAARQAAGCGTEPARRPARLRTEAR